MMAMLTGVTDARSDVGRMVAMLGLGDVLHRPVNLKPGDVNPVWAVRTSTGRWVVKTHKPAGPWWFDGARRARRLEEAAISAGIHTPAPAPSAGATVGFWSRIGEGTEETYARAMRHLDGPHPSLPLQPEQAAWVGRTLALLERADLPVDATAEAAYRQYDADDWDAWIAEAVGRQILTGGQGRLLARLAGNVNERATAEHDGHGARLMHRDVSRANIILTADRGPALLDFDHAGAQNPWWETVGHAFALATPHLGRSAPDERAVRSVIAAYHTCGGTGGPADETALTGTLAARLTVAAWQLWVACGHRGGNTESQAIAANGARRAIEEIDSIVRHASTWARWLNP